MGLVPVVCLASGQRLRPPGHSVATDGLHTECSRSPSPPATLSTGRGASQATLPPSSLSGGLQTLLWSENSVPGLCLQRLAKFSLCLSLLSSKAPLPTATQMPLFRAFSLAVLPGTCHAGTPRPRPLQPSLRFTSPPAALQQPHGCPIPQTLWPTRTLGTPTRPPSQPPHTNPPVLHKHPLLHALRPAMAQLGPTGQNFLQCMSKRSTGYQASALQGHDLALPGGVGSH